MAQVLQDLRESSSVVRTRVASRLGTLTGGQSKVAEYILEHPGEVVFLGVRDLARRTGTSTATVVRLAQALGFSGYPALLEELQRDLMERIHPTARLAATLDEIRRSGASQEDLLRHALEQDATALSETAQLVAGSEFADAVTILDAARVVYICGSGLSVAPIETLAFRLRRLGLPVITAGASGAQLYNLVLPIGPDDVMVAIGSQPVSGDLVAIARFARERGATVLAITDTQVSPLHEHARVTLHAKRGPLTHLTSVVAPLALANALAVGLAARRTTEAEAMYAAFERLESHARDAH